MNIDLKNVSNYIGTRNIGQVRSHLQKYLLKQKKLKEKSNKKNMNKNESEESNIKNNNDIKLQENEEEKGINLEEDFNRHKFKK